MEMKMLSYNLISAISRTSKSLTTNLILLNLRFPKQKEQEPVHELKLGEIP